MANHSNVDVATIEDGQRGDSPDPTAIDKLQSAAQQKNGERLPASKNGAADHLPNVEIGNENDGFRNTSLDHTAKPDRETVVIPDMANKRAEEIYEVLRAVSHYLTVNPINTINENAKSPQDIVDQLLTHQTKAQRPLGDIRIEVLGEDQGRIKIGQQTYHVDDPEVINAFKQLKGHMAPGSKIIFDGCRTGSGDEARPRLQRLADETGLNYVAYEENGNADWSGNGRSISASPRNSSAQSSDAKPQRSSDNLSSANDRSHSSDAHAIELHSSSDRNVELKWTTIKTQDGDKRVVEGANHLFYLPVRETHEWLRLNQNGYPINERGKTLFTQRQVDELYKNKDVAAGNELFEQLLRERGAVLSDSQMKQELTQICK